MFDFSLFLAEFQVIITSFAKKRQNTAHAWQIASLVALARNDSLMGKNAFYTEGSLICSKHILVYENLCNLWLKLAKKKVSLLPTKPFWLISDENIKTIYSLSCCCERLLWITPCYEVILVFFEFYPIRFVGNIGLNPPRLRVVHTEA